jgi:hypothetical protein
MGERENGNCNQICENLRNLRENKSLRLRLRFSYLDRLFCDLMISFLFT